MIDIPVGHASCRDSGDDPGRHSRTSATVDTHSNPISSWPSPSSSSGRSGTYLLLPHRHGAAKPRDGARASGRSWPALGLLLFADVLEAARPVPDEPLLLRLQPGRRWPAAVLTVTSRNPVYSALWFASVVLSTSGLFLLAGAQFLAAGTVIVYAGAIIVTFLFVIMLAQMEGRATYDRAARLAVPGDVDAASCSSGPCSTRCSWSSRPLATASALVRQRRRGLSRTAARPADQDLGPGSIAAGPRSGGRGRRARLNDRAGPAEAARRRTGRDALHRPPDHRRAGRRPAVRRPDRRPGDRDPQAADPPRRPDGRRRATCLSPRSRSGSPGSIVPRAKRASPCRRPMRSRSTS